MYNLNKKTGCDILKLRDPRPINTVNSIIKKVFKGKENISDTKLFRKKLLKCQDLRNEAHVHREIILSNKDYFKNLLGVNKLEKDMSVQTVIYFRGVRPKKAKKSEYLDFHRENFYNDSSYIEKQINIHIPVKNYNLKNSLKYIKASHLIPDKKLTLMKLNSRQSGIKRFSTGHKLGITYHPKKITSGINFNKAKRLNISRNKAFVFSARLLHGGGVNLSNKTRFSLDFGILKTKDIKNDQKKAHFASYHKSKKHYIDLKNL